MAKKTTVKPISLKYGDVGSGCEVKLMGVLKGLTVGQDEPDSTEIEAEFFDAPFDIFYDGNPVTFNFELANYSLDELPALFGGAYDAETDTYEGAANAFTSEHSWELEFQRGVASLYLYRGLTLGTIKKDEDGALNYAVTITALNWTDTNNVEHMYKIKSTRAKTYAFNVMTSSERNAVVTGHTTMDVGGQTVGAVTCSDGSVLPVVIDEANGEVWLGADNWSDEVGTDAFTEYVTVANSGDDSDYANPQLIPLLYDAGARFGATHAMEYIKWIYGIEGSTRSVSKLYNVTGHDANVSVLSAAEENDSIMVFSHLNHPQQCINGNMSGYVEYDKFDGFIYLEIGANAYIAMALGVPEQLAMSKFEAVDLGLPSGTLWGNMNVGANSMGESGDFFSWGNVFGVTADNAGEITRAAYAYTSGATLTGDIVQGSSNDAAAAYLGGKWVTPSSEQTEELTNLRCYAASFGTKQGTIMVGSNGNQIFIPREGKIIEGKIENTSNMGFLWNTHLYTKHNQCGCIGVSGTGAQPDNSDRHNGLSIRPVLMQ